jgi:hypothetical protein
MFFSPRGRSDGPLYIIVKSQNGIMSLAMGSPTRTWRSANAASAEAARLAAKHQDGKYFVFQAIAVSEVVTPRAVTRALAPAGEAMMAMSSVEAAE